MKAIGKSLMKSAQKGFTLIELVVVVAVLGILIAIVAPGITGSRDGANSQLLVRSANSIAQNWQMIAQQCGTPTQVSGSPIGTLTDVIFTGATAVNATYQSCYTQTRVLPLTEVSLSQGGGVYTIAGYPVTVTGGGTSPLLVTFANVPDTLVLSVAQRFNSGITVLPATADTTGPAFQYGAPSGGARSLTFVKNI